MFFDNILGEEEIKDYSQEYLSFRPMKKLTKFKYEVLGTVTTNGNVNGYLQYSRDGGCTWKDLQPDTYTEDIRFNDVVMWRKNENVTITPSPGDIVSKIYYWQEGGSHDPFTITSLGKQLNPVNVYNTNTDEASSGGSIHFSSNGNFEAYGNPASILYDNDFNIYGNEQPLPAYAFARMFNNNTYLYKADKLYLSYNVLSEYCCSYMFNRCTNLYYTPQLYSTNLAKACYAFMFAEIYNDNIGSDVQYPKVQPRFKCDEMGAWSSNYPSGYEYAPKVLPAEILAERCYYGMYLHCGWMRVVPLIKAKTAAKECCMKMFLDSGWFSSAFVKLNFETLAKGCCAYMLTWSSLVPQFYSKTLTDKCYYALNAQSYIQFQYPLNEIINLAKEVDETTTWENATRIWIGHESEGINNSVVRFIKNDDYEWTKINGSHAMSGAIPSKWTVKNYSEVNS